MKLRLLPLAPLPLAFLLSGCLGDVMEIFCNVGPDPDHCFQATAIQEGEPEKCQKVAGDGFSGSNPPRDKCYLQIAGNTGDPSVCDNIEGGFMSYSKEECLKDVLGDHTPDDCKDAKDEAACRTAYAINGRGCGEGYDLKNGSCNLKTVENSDANDDIETKVSQDLNTMKDAATGQYMELLTQAIEHETDEAKKEGLEAYKKFLEQSGETLESVQTSVETLKEIKKIFLDSYDSSMDIDKMPVNKILDPGFFDRVSERIFGADPPTERGKAESALEVYEKMLERQGEIDFLQKGRLERLGNVIAEKAKGSLAEQVKEKATAVAEGVAGTAFAAVGIVDHALSSFQAAAQKEMFTGLAAAYNRQRDSIAARNPTLSHEEIHRRTVAGVMEDPYQDVPNAGFVKYGNILENKDCQEEGNPLCIDRRVFWTAMDKSYEYTHKK